MRGMFYVNATELLAGTFHDAVAVLQQGARTRAVGATQANKRSSRSHAIFSLMIEKVGLGGWGVGIP